MIFTVLQSSIYLTSVHHQQQHCFTFPLIYLIICVYGVMCIQKSLNFRVINSNYFKMIKIKLQITEKSILHYLDSEFLTFTSKSTPFCISQMQPHD